jgi:hypothetical protein
MKRVAVFFVLSLVCAPSLLAENRPVAGGSFGGSFQSAVSLPSAMLLPQMSFSGYGYASLSDRLFIGGFGEGFGGKETTSGYGGLALGVWLNRGESAWYLLSFTGVGLLGYRGVPRLGVLEEATINRGVFLSDRFLLSFYLGLNAQANLSGQAFVEYLSLAPVLGARIDFGKYGRGTR